MIATTQAGHQFADLGPNPAPDPYYPDDPNPNPIPDRPKPKPVPSTPPVKDPPISDPKPPSVDWNYLIKP